jgi:hypothetical protein
MRNANVSRGNVPDYPESTRRNRYVKKIIMRQGFWLGFDRT